ncbi:MAG TPA: chemotaxis response regulator protein-glutamate methylesterase [Gammaproteobacteria bacterium]|nr:chemotaxis response regulator protein-glutamate methylesterase [Gammaproteobacteria bacterium]
MPIRVLVVDDSSFFRKRVSAMIESHPSLHVIATAEDGEEAIEKAHTLRPDVITMDVEMPVMDGITAVRRIMARDPVPILMFSSLTSAGAQATLDALDAGAVDFLPKRFEAISDVHNEVTGLLCARILSIARRSAGAARFRSARTAVPVTPVPACQRDGERASVRNTDILLIGASTGGPAALQHILPALPRDFPLPVVIVQHMPGAFTGPFADRLDKMSRIHVKEAEQGDRLVPGCALLAPGGKQLVVQKVGGNGIALISENKIDTAYRPSIDVTLSSLALHHNGRALAIILTGMGADGCAGAAALKSRGGLVWTQDEQSSVVYGMPHAVAAAGLADKTLALQDIGAALVSVFCQDGCR